MQNLSKLVQCKSSVCRGAWREADKNGNCESCGRMLVLRERSTADLMDELAAAGYIQGA